MATPGPVAVSANLLGIGTLLLPAVTAYSIRRADPHLTAAYHP
ncbi:hypothetical protein [Streptomyces sp. NPDC093097]